MNIKLDERGRPRSRYKTEGQKNMRQRRAGIVDGQRQRLG
jgi:hypothetical protein